MTAYWKLGILVGWTMIAFLSGWHIESITLEAQHTKELQAQIIADNAKKAEVESRAAQAETELASSRQQYASINSKWREALAKPHTLCTLSADSIGLLQDATANHVSR
jgi:hypothetical protein